LTPRTKIDFKDIRIPQRSLYQSLIEGSDPDIETKG